MTHSVENPLILIDGSSYLYRAYYAYPNLTTHSNFPTGAMYGVLNMLRSLLTKHQHSYVAVVFDAHGKTFRDELFVEYKSHRPSMPDDLQVQIQPLYKMIKYIGLPLLVVPGVEADDVIGTLALEAEKSGHSVLISTDDKDMAQLVTSKINLIHSLNNRIIGPQEVVEKYGITPELMIDFLALVGDPSDNIPGVPGIGKKSAQVLLQRLGGIRKIYSNLDKLIFLALRGSKNIISKLEKHKDMAFLSYQLATIRTNLTLSLSSSQLLYSEPVIPNLIELLKKYEFNKLVSDLKNQKWWKWHQKVKFTIIVDTIEQVLEDKLETIKTLEFSKYLTILDKVTFITWVKILQNKKHFSFYINTDSLEVFQANIIGLSFSVQKGQAIYLPILNNDKQEPSELNGFEVLRILKPVLEDPTIVKIGKNLKFYCGVLKRYNIKLQGICFDVLLESYVLESIGHCYDIYTLAKRWLNYDLAIWTKINKKNIDSRILNWFPMQVKNDRVAMIYADVILQLHFEMWKQLNTTKGPKYIFEEVDMPLIPVLLRIEQAGVLIDRDLLCQYSKEISYRVENLEKEAYKLAGEPFNLSSPKQIQMILFEKHGIKPIKKTSTGNLSTNEAVLSQLSPYFPLANIILEYRGLIKLQSSYINKLLRMIHLESERIHTSYHQIVTVTGRLSSSNPNLQNIPVRNYTGRRIRQAFIAPNGYCIMSADYSQIELRIMAHFSQDSQLLLDFSTEQDVHCVTAAEIFGVKLKEVTKDQRRRAKEINFGLIYGMSAFGLAHRLHIGVREAKRYMDCYFERYPGVLKYMRNTCKKAAEQGYVSTLNGRRLYLPDINSKNGVRRQAAERAAINAPLQGTAADIIKRTMISIDQWLLTQNTPLFRMIIQVHDELVFEVKNYAIKDSSIKICTLMEKVIKLDVPLRVDIGVGANWDQAH
ncbi:DNA polymerase I [Candidatus Erwinia haradaeae]|uniref:DNA polymerase I n=1 Tax=Candidatus Erwinia haradaeae TaxID=1922217 RepID=A0A451D1I1_9GAMM|nr:DNA polymerase I [Candidatus Erwinia haradaeae]VFP79467.1 DNA polymerase I [Candidatus Erwinia haradaeae]